MTLHSAKGLEFPVVIMAGPRGRTVPALAVERGPGGARRGAPAVLRRHDARAHAAGADRRGAAAHLRRVSVERAVAVHRRSARRARRPRRLRRRPVRPIRDTFRTTNSAPTPTAADAAAAAARREEAPAYAYEDEDQSTGMSLRPGMRVRHPQFGVGSVISVEALADDTKLVVRFARWGSRRCAPNSPASSRRSSGSRASGSEAPVAPKPGHRYADSHLASLTTVLFGSNPRRTAIRAAVLIVASAVVFGVILLPVRLSGISMEPTYSDGEMNFANRLAYAVGRAARPRRRRRHPDGRDECPVREADCRTAGRARRDYDGDGARSTASRSSNRPSCARRRGTCPPSRSATTSIS